MLNQVYFSYLQFWPIYTARACKKIKYKYFCSLPLSSKFTYSKSFRISAIGFKFTGFLLQRVKNICLKFQVYRLMCF